VSLNIPISICGQDYEVSESFFEKLVIIKEELIGDTYFLKCEDNLKISVQKNFYILVKRVCRINYLLDQSL
jgi:hypothetical protein